MKWLHEMARWTLAVAVGGALPLLADETAETTLTSAGQALEKKYAEELKRLQSLLAAKLPSEQSADAESLRQFLSSDALDREFASFVVLHEATPRGLAEFAQQGKEQADLVNALFSQPELMKEMLVADGAAAPSLGRNGFGPAQYGQATEIYAKIRKASEKSADGVLRRLALAIALEHAVPIKQNNPAAATNAPATVDPIKRYLHYEKALAEGELDPAFDRLSTWELRMVVDGEEPDETLAWGRKMLRNYRPDHIFNPNYGWRYVGIVTSDVKYGSGDVKHDRPELQQYQNILMNGGVCGRRAFFGRFILRAFGIPTTARPSRGHAALAHWTPDGWVVNLGGGWGAGWTKTRYNKDRNFLATTQARIDPTSFLMVKRAQWAGDVVGEARVYGEEDQKTEPGFWNALALRTQRKIIEEGKSVTLDALGEELGEADGATVAERVLSTPVTEDDKTITVDASGVMTIPAAAFSKPSRSTREVVSMKSFDGGLQVFLPRFFPKGLTIMRGGTWKGEPDALTSGNRMLSGGYGKYENWGLRAAVTAPDGATAKEASLDLGNGITMEMVYIPPGKFVMGGESTTEGRFQCIEVPKREVELTMGFYLGKYEVTQAQYEAIMGNNPSRSTKAPDCPVDNVGVAEALEFCQKLATRTGQETRLPTEAEWEYASRAGADSKWFFGDDPSRIGEYAWFKGNAGGKSHPVGQKKPNPWGLYDIYGNVNERISDTYSKNYYAKGPKVDPTGPSQGTNSHFEYEIKVPRAGNYLLSALVVTANYDQRLNVAVNGEEDPTVMEMPFTEGSWRESEPVMLSLEQGSNLLQLWRDFPPQYGMGIKRFTLKPAR